MLAIRSPQALVEGPEVRRTVAWPERMPVRRFSIFDDRAGARRVVFIESDPSSHVEKLPDRGSFVGCFTHLRDHGRDLAVRIENSFADQNPCKKPEQRLRKDMRICGVSAVIPSAYRAFPNPANKPVRPQLRNRIRRSSCESARAPRSVSLGCMAGRVCCLPDVMEIKP
jgi:hypothetical protein